ncbi:MAG TPA: Mut7-C RNAse domain-containing protein [Steroidobacter sp.]|nr:Mut7-C RNAse domain-containing protein [Steroidobacter sp.]
MHLRRTTADATAAFVIPRVGESALTEFRFYEELNDFLPPHARKRTLGYRIRGAPAVKNAIEAIGVPHTEVDLILVNGDSVNFSHRLHGGERVAVYPTFERLDVAPLVRLRPAPLRTPRFIADVHLGTLAKYLRLLGFDTLYDAQLEDRALVRLSVDEHRVLLTRDVALLKHKALTHAYFVRNTRPQYQIGEVVRVLDLNRKIRAFSRCMACNGKMRRVARRSVAAVAPSAVLATAQRFVRCNECRRVYWAGSHIKGLARIIAASGSQLAHRP